MTRDARLHALLETHATAIEAVVQRYVDDAMERDDLRQEIVIAIWRALPRLDSADDPRAYVLRIARNRAVTFCLRRARRHARLLPLDDSLRSAHSISGEFDVRQLLQHATGALAHLSPSQQHLLALAAAGRTPAEIARDTGREAGAVRVALHRARTLLRRWMDRATEDR